MARMDKPPRDWFTYPLLFASVNNGDTTTGTFTIQANSDFYWTHGTAYVSEAASGLPFLAYQGAMTGGSIIPSWPFTVKITDAGSQFELMNEPVALSSVFGNGLMGGRMELPYPRFFQNNSTMSVELNRFAEGQFDEAGASTNLNVRVHLMFEGFRIFDRSQLNLTKRRR